MTAATDAALIEMLEAHRSMRWCRTDPLWECWCGQIIGPTTLDDPELERRHRAHVASVLAGWVRQQQAEAATSRESEGWASYAAEQERNADLRARIAELAGPCGDCGCDVDNHEDDGIRCTSHESCLGFIRSEEAALDDEAARWFRRTKDANSARQRAKAERDRLVAGIKALADDPVYAQIVVEETPATNRTVKTDPTPLVLVSDLRALLDADRDGEG